MCKILANILLTKTSCIRVRDGYKKQTQEGASDLNTAFKFFTNHIHDSSSLFSPNTLMTFYCRHKFYHGLSK